MRDEAPGLRRDGRLGGGAIEPMAGDRAARGRPRTIRSEMARAAGQSDERGHADPGGRGGALGPRGRCRGGRSRRGRSVRGDRGRRRRGRHVGARSGRGGRWHLGHVGWAPVPRWGDPDPGGVRLRRFGRGHVRLPDGGLWPRTRRGQGPRLLRRVDGALRLVGRPGGAVQGGVPRRARDGAAHRRRTGLLRRRGRLALRRRHRGGAAGPQAPGRRGGRGLPDGAVAGRGRPGGAAGRTRHRR